MYFLTWSACNQSLKGYKNAIYNKFSTEAEAGELTFTPDYCVYTVGSCIHNGKHNAKAGIGIFFDVKDPRNISKKIQGKPTNNVAEITAVIETFAIIKNDVKNGKHIVIQNTQLNV